MALKNPRYDFFSPRRIVFGWGRAAELGTLCAGLGKRAFVINGSRTLENDGTIGRLLDLVRLAGVEVVELGQIQREPLVSDVDVMTAKLVTQGVQPERDIVVGIGGGSALDLAKAVAAMATNRHAPSVRDFLEGVGSGAQIFNTPLPMVAVPTTAGTGSEATKNAVISSIDPVFKKSLRSDDMVPSLVVVDPELTVALPAKTTAYTGMDAVTQLIESYLSCRSQPLPSALAYHGLQGVLEALTEAVENGSTQWAREKMSQAALWSGMALANSGLGMAHGVAAALGVYCNIPHGLACAVMLPISLRANFAVSKQALAELSLPLTGRAWPDPDSGAHAVVERIAEVCQHIGIPPRLGSLGVTADQLPELVQASRGNSMNGNPRPIDDDELFRILEENLQNAD